MCHLPSFLVVDRILPLERTEGRKEGRKKVTYKDQTNFFYMYCIVHCEVKFSCVLNFCSNRPKMSSDLTRLKCSLRKCIQGALEPEMARVEVKSFEVSENDSDHMEVGWMENGEAMFHDICWKAVMDSQKIDNPFRLCPVEKEMVKEAKKTAEYFDSAERVKHEARRIAAMLKTADYGMVFTGKTQVVAQLCDNQKCMTQIS